MCGGGGGGGMLGGMELSVGNFLCNLYYFIV